MQIPEIVIVVFFLMPVSVVCIFLYLIKKRIGLWDYSLVVSFYKVPKEFSETGTAHKGSQSYVHSILEVCF